MTSGTPHRGESINLRVCSSSTPVSGSGYVNLVAGSKTYNLNISGSNNLNGLVQAINNANAGVTAAVSSGSLTIATNDSSAATLQLNDMSPVSLISGANQGSNADFFVNGIEVTRSSNTINDVISGVSFTLQNTTNSTSPSAKLSIAADASQLSGALQSFVSSYNSLVDQVGQQVGQSGGALTGDLMIHQISSDMQLLATYWSPSSSSSIHSLSDLGVTFDTTGKMSFDSTALSGLSVAQVSDAFKFLGNSSSGFAALANNFTQLTDPISGLIQMQETGYQTANTRLSQRITEQNDRVNQIQAAMMAKLQAADALVAQLQSAQNTISAAVQSANYVLYGRQTNLNGM